MSAIIKVENLSKQYRLGQVGTGTISHDVNRWWHKIRGKENPYLKIGESNDRTVKSESDYVWALKDVNFEVQEGEVLGIIGRNGAGKSTLLKILSRTTAPTTGSVKIKGRVASLLEVGTGFHPELSGRDNIFLNGAILGMTRREIQSNFDEIVDFAGVERYIDTPVKRYSSGMYVRLAFAVAAHLEPEILIVDEVLAVGDAEFQKKALGKMKDVSRGQGRTVLFVSHNITAIKQLCITGAFYNQGTLVSQGVIENVVSEYNRHSKIQIENINQIGVFNLESHPKKLDPNFGIIKVKLYCDDKLTNVVYSGSTVKLEIFYNAKRDLINGEIGIVIRDSNDISILGLNNHHLGNQLIISKGKGKRNIEIKDFPIFAYDRFWVSLYFGDKADDYEVLQDIFSFEVVTGDVYKSGNILDLQFNKIYHKGISIF